MKQSSDTYSSIRRRSTIYFVLLTCCFMSLCSGDGNLRTSVFNKNDDLLPIFFFHGVTGNPSSGDKYAANLTAEDRLFTVLSFCPDLCSVGALDNQVKLAIDQIRSTVANDGRYDDGYVFIGYSQGGLIARAVIEEMDDHRVQVSISLVGAQNGLFNGPQPTDYMSLLVFATYFGPLLFLPTLFNFSQHSPADYAEKLQRDFEEEWVKSSPFLPVYNNINDCKAVKSITQVLAFNQVKKCELEKKPRRRNFLKLQALHLFVSLGNDVIAPWQASLMAQYSNVNSLDEIQSKFASLEIVNMENTLEYVDDMYGLRTLDKRGRFFLHTVPGICHSCRTSDNYPVAGGALCEFKPLYDKYIYPVLKDPLWFGGPKAFADAF